jgi:hypothetical protein
MEKSFLSFFVEAALVHCDRNREIKLENFVMEKVEKN